MAEHVCGRCKWWTKQGGTAESLSAVVQGQPTVGICRGAPPVPVLVPSPRGPALQFMYPLTAETEPACRQFCTALTVLTNGEGA